ncbi:FHA domain-containing protein [Kitasatospora sp. NPDC127111]|uniref:FHA domain-containing protein n=1 Tax=Kitasatospora sp. NPDC127111 TaxID=3345363 RepID=UPI00362E1F3D
MNPPSQDQALPRLVVDSPDEVRGQVYELDREPLLVGRGSACRIQLVDPWLSRRHAVVWRADGHTTVEDLSSTNGTRLNGHLVLGQQQLHSGDVLDFGPLEVHYEEPRVEAATEPHGNASAPEAVTEPHADGPAPDPLTVVTDEPASPPPRSRAARPEPAPQDATPQDVAAREEAVQAETAPQEAARSGPQEHAERKDHAGRQSAAGQAGQRDGPRAAGPLVDTPPRGAPGYAVPPKPATPPHFGPGPHPGPDPSAGKPSAGKPSASKPGASKPGASKPYGPYQRSERYGPRFDVGQQHDGHFNNIGGNQYNYQILQDNHILAARREAFFRKLATIRKTARHLATTGFVLAVLAGTYLGLANAGKFSLDEERGGIKASSIGVPVMVIGAVLLVIGISMTVWTVVRQHRYLREEDRRLHSDSSPSARGGAGP